MTNLQAEFFEFDKKIKLSYNDNAELRKKRDILIEKLMDKITTEAADFSYFNQGSYAMHTGIKPDDGDYDIDIGLRFKINRIDCPNPLTVKKWVFDALDGHTKKVQIRRSCVTVTYQEKGEDAFHIDFACYADEDDNLYIAKGRMNSKDENIYWESSNPRELLEKMNDKFSNGDEPAQFRRIIRFMKKWKNKHFDLKSNAAPTGIALTALAYDTFIPKFETNIVTGKRTPNDFVAMMKFVDAIKKKFSLFFDEDDKEYYHVIKQDLFVAPYNDLF